FHDTAPAPLYPLSLHDALPICFGWHAVASSGREFDTTRCIAGACKTRRNAVVASVEGVRAFLIRFGGDVLHAADHSALGGILRQDRKSTRLNSSHVKISYAVFC